MSHYTAVRTIIGCKHIDLFFSVYSIHILHSLGSKLEIKIIAVQKKWQCIPITPIFLHTLRQGSRILICMSPQAYSAKNQKCKSDFLFLFSGRTIPAGFQIYKSSFFLISCRTRNNYRCMHRSSSSTFLFVHMNTRTPGHRDKPPNLNHTHRQPKLHKPNHHHKFC
jgi:hypothetical protein